MRRLKEGQFYRRRDGFKAGPMVYADKDRAKPSDYPFFDPIRGGRYSLDGQFYIGRAVPEDIISEFIPITVKVKVPLDIQIWS